MAREFTLGFGGGGMRTISGGMDRLPRAIAARLSPVIHYGVPVVRIEQDAREVRVTVLRGGVREQVSGDVVLCTIPFGVLRGIDVSPAFSSGKQRAIHELSYGSVTRVFVQVRRRAWLDDGCNGFANTDWPEELWHPTWNQPGTRGILVSYMRWQRARTVAAMTERQRTNVMLDHLERIHPGVRKEFEGTTTVSWDNDPYARGA